MRQTFAACCANAASGQADAEPTMLMKSRRLIAFLEGWGLRRLQCDYSRDLRQAKWGSECKLHGSNYEPLMSALGQKQTSRHVCAMSALPPKADIDRACWDFRVVPIPDIRRRSILG